MIQESLFVLGVLMHTCNPCSQEAEIGGIPFKASRGKIARPYLKKN
jgi:hypothetical protein